MKMDKNGGGSEKDGSINKIYCSSCYQNGVFTSPNMTLEEMQKLVDGILKNEMKWWKPFRWLATKQMQKLERWKTK